MKVKKINKKAKRIINGYECYLNPAGKYSVGKITVELH